MQRAVAWFAENHVAANLLMLFLLIAGAFTCLTMKIEVFPEASLDRIFVSMVYPGASPEEVEEGIVRKIEESLAGLAGINRIDSVALEGYGYVNIEVMKGWDLTTLLDDIKAEVDRIRTFPEEAEEPVVREVIRRNKVIWVAIYGDAPEKTLKYLAENIKDDITNLKGVTLASLLGVRKGEIQIEISEAVLCQFGLTLGRVADTVRKTSLDLPAGRIKTTGGEILVRTKGRRYHAADYSNVAVVSRPDGSIVTLGEIARLKDGFEDVDLFARFQGKPAALIRVFRVADQNALAVVKQVKAYIERIRPGLPAGVEIGYFGDDSKFLRSRLRLLLKNLMIGLLLVIILLGLMLNIRLAFWVTLGIPISFSAGLMLLPQFNVSINMVSLFAFIMVLGVVVDDAIIIGDNIFRKSEQGLPPLRAAAEGTIEVGRPVVFSVLTTIVAFWPLLLGGGFMGKMMRNIPIVIILVLIGSLIESLFILPAHMARSKGMRSGRNRTGQKEKRSSRWLKWFIRVPYGRVLGFCLRWRYATVAAGVMLLILTFGAWKAGWFKFVFFPKVEGDTLECRLTMPVGTSAERTRDVVAHLERCARETLAQKDEKRAKNAPPLFEFSISLVGWQQGRTDNGGHLANIWIQVPEEKNRGVSTKLLSSAWRDHAGSIPDVESLDFRSERHGAGKSVEFHLSSADHGMLMMAVEDLKQELKSYPGVSDVADSFLPGKKELQLNLKPAARSLGLTLSDLAQQVRHAFYGCEALRLQRYKDEVKVMVRYPESERRSLKHIEQMRIRTADGMEVPFNRVAQVRLRRGYASIERGQRRRVVKVTADANESVINANELRTTMLDSYLPELKSRYADLSYSMEGEGKEQKEAMADVYRGFAVALFGIYCLLAIPFKSFTQPVIVMAAIPFALVGAVAGHLIMGMNVSLLSLCGMVGLTGVVVNDSLVLIYTTNRLRKQGKVADIAITDAASIRFRAIILTSLTTFAGLTPMLMEKSLQAKFLIPMAVSLGFGVLFATFITLLLIPCGYLILEDMHHVWRSIKEKIAY
ncbi:MAG: efflux RND transporter permease subunit [Desulfobacterales bacterium]|nr:efflux RND transporter permease subunit [Desulfobacterales bacterium]